MLLSNRFTLAIMAVKLQRSHRYWYHTFITSDGGNFPVDSTRSMAEHSTVMRKLIHDASEIRKPKYPPIYLPFCNSSEFEMFRQYVETPAREEMMPKIKFDNFETWFIIAKKFQLAPLKLYCIYFVHWEVHDVSPSLDYVLKLATIVCRHRIRLAFKKIVKFYCLYHPNLMSNTKYMHQLSEILPKSALAILSLAMTQYAKWDNRFSHDWGKGRCLNGICAARTLMCRRCFLKFCPKCGNYRPVKYKNSSRFVCAQCNNIHCHCNFKTCASCAFCRKKWIDCFCKEEKISDIMWKDDFDDI